MLEGQEDIMERKMSFSQRAGLEPAMKIVQKKSIDQELANSLWNAITMTYIDTVEFKGGAYDAAKYSNRATMLESLWVDLFKKPIDEMPFAFTNIIKLLKKIFFNATWNKKLELVEAVLDCGPPELGQKFTEMCNEFLKRENSAYRFVSGKITEITSDIEIEAIESAISSSGRFGGAKKHLETALAHMNSWDAPDYRNSIKESISAVESVAKVLSGKDKVTLGNALKLLEKNEDIHKAQKDAFSALYGWTNDAGGMRHALMDESTLQKSDALYMLVTCSAFVNYLISRTI